jgi:CheY-like chemotaxis protein
MEAPVRISESSCQDRRNHEEKAGTLEEKQNSRVTALLRTLIVENSPPDVERMLSELADFSFAVEYTLVETREEFVAALAGNNFNALLADYRLPGWSGLDALAELRRISKDIPFLM